MITRITVDGFRSLAGFEIELGHVNVLIGSNGSGKTNLLEAIGVLGAAASGRVDDSRLRERGVRLSGPGRYSTRLAEVATGPQVDMTAESQDDGRTAKYEVSLEPPANGNLWRYAQERGVEADQVVLDRVGEPNGALNAEAGWAALKRVELPPQGAMASLLSRVEGYAVYAPTTPVLRSSVQDPLMREPVGVSGHGLPEGVWGLVLRSVSEGPHDRSYFRRVVEGAQSLIDWARNVRVQTRGGRELIPGEESEAFELWVKDRYMADEWRDLPIAEASEGALYVLFAAAVAAHPRVPAFLAVDDFDHALNPRLARALVEHFCGWVIDNPVPRQVLLTTHNPLILDGLDLTDDRIRLFAVGRTSYGRTMAHRVEVDERLLARAKEGWTLSRLWVMGELGGVPPV
jgi:predicted ATPase